MQSWKRGKKTDREPKALENRGHRSQHTRKKQSYESEFLPATHVHAGFALVTHAPKLLFLSVMVLNSALTLIHHQEVSVQGQENSNSNAPGKLFNPE